VAEVANRKLAPKASVNAKATKEAWMQGRAGKGIGTNRKVVTGGLN